MKPVVCLIKDDTYVIWNFIGVSGDHTHQIIGLDDMEYEERRFNNITSWDISREYPIKNKIFKEIIFFPYDGVNVIRYYIHTDVLKRKLRKEEVEFLEEAIENGKINIRDEKGIFELDVEAVV